MSEPDRAVKGLESYRYCTEAATDPTFVDPPRHVNNLGISALFDRQRQTFLKQEIGYHDDFDTHPLQVTLGHMAIRFLTELQHPQCVVLGLQVSRIGTASFVLRQGLYVNARAIAVCDSAFVNLGSAGSAPIPPDRRALLEAFL